MQAVWAVGQYGGHHVLGVIALQQHGQTRVHEVGDFSDGVGGQFARRETVKRVLHQGWQAHRVLHQHAHHAQSGATQGVRVFVTRWNQAYAPNADDGFELVGQSHAGGHCGFRQGIACKTRLVVLFQSLRHHGGFAIVLGVILAHRAL